MAKYLFMLAVLPLLAAAAAAAVAQDAENRVNHHKGAERPHSQVEGHTPVADPRPGKRSGQGRHGEGQRQENHAVSRHRVGEDRHQAVGHPGNEPSLLNHRPSEVTRPNTKPSNKGSGSQRRLGAHAAGAHVAGGRMNSERQVGVFRQQSRQQGEGRRVNRRGPNGKGHGHSGSKPGRHGAGQSRHRTADSGNDLHSSIP